MDRLTMDDIHFQHLWLRATGIAETKKDHLIYLIRFVRSFTDPDTHRSNLLRLTKGNYG